MDIYLSIFDVSNYFLTIEGMTHKKLQKLCYYAQAYHLAVSGEPLFSNNFEAWIHGPVCPELFYQYKGFLYISCITSKHEFNDKIKNFLDSIYSVYGSMTGDELEELTHSEMPWKKARAGLEYNQPSNSIININDMRSYYKNILNE